MNLNNPADNRRRTTVLRAALGVGLLAGLAISTPASAAPADAGPSSAETLPAEFFPDGTNFLAVLRIDKILESPAAKKILAKHPDAAAWLDRPFEPKISVTPREVETVVVAMNAADVIPSQEYRVVYVVRLKKASPQPNVFIDADGFESVDDRRVYAIGEDRGACLVDSQSLVIARLEILREVLRRKRVVKETFKIEAGFQDFEPAKLAWIAMTGAVFRTHLPHGGVGTEPIRRLSCTFEFNDPLRLEAEFRCIDENDARETANLLERFLEGQKVFQRIKSDAAGLTATLTAEFTPETVVELFEKRR